MVKLLKGVFVLLVILAALALVGRIFVFQLGRTQSYSMVPNLVAGDLFAVLTVGRTDLGEIAVCEDPERPGMMVVLRVMGIPGQTVSFRRNGIRIDGRPVHHEYSDPLLYVDRTSGEELSYAVHVAREHVGGRRFEVALMDRAGGRDHDAVTVPDGHFFLVGDNRNMARDSRHFGPVPIGSCVGRAAFLIWPGDDSGDLTFRDRMLSWL